MRSREAPSEQHDNSILGKVMGAAMQGSIINGSKFCKRVYPPMLGKHTLIGVNGQLQMKREDSNSKLCGQKRMFSEPCSGDEDLHEDRADSKEEGIIHSHDEDGELFEGFKVPEESKQVRQSDEIIKVKEEVMYKTEH